MDDEEEPGREISPATLLRGLYSQAGFRHRGWLLVDVEDRESPDEICQACRRQQVRYVHLLTHEDKSTANNFGRLEAGCVCAGYLINDYVEAATFERRLKAEAARKIRAAKKAVERAAREQAAEVRRREAVHRRRLAFSSSWRRDAQKPSTTRQGSYTVFLGRGSYGIRYRIHGFVKAVFASETEAQAFALLIEFGEVIPEYEGRS